MEVVLHGQMGKELIVNQTGAQRRKLAGRKFLLVLENVLGDQEVNNRVADKLQLLIGAGHSIFSEGRMCEGLIQVGHLPELIAKSLPRKLFQLTRGKVNRLLREPGTRQLALRVHKIRLALLVGHFKVQPLQEGLGTARARMNQKAAEQRLHTIGQCLVHRLVLERTNLVMSKENIHYNLYVMLVLVNVSFPFSFINVM